MGTVIGFALTSENPNWSEVEAFIRNLEELNEADIATLKMLWKTQRGAYKVDAVFGRQMSTNVNDYTSSWNTIVDNARKQGIPRDEWQHRCLRLTGYGLLAPVQPNSTFQGLEDSCYRLTSAGVRLLGLLGRNIDTAAYPAWRYHPSQKPTVVNDEDEEAALGPGCSNKPNAE